MPAVCDGTLLITPDTETRVQTNRDGSSARPTYAIQQRGSGGEPAIATVDEYGHLVSGARTGHASLVVTAHEEFEVNQTLVIHIKVSADCEIAEFAVCFAVVNALEIIETEQG